MSIFNQETQLPSYEKSIEQLVSMMRMYLRDYPHLNRLIDGEETSDRMIAWAILDAVEDFNTTPPFIGNIGIGSLVSIPMLRDKVVCTILESLYILQTRNQVNYSDGGISFSISDKGSALYSFIQLLNQRYDMKVVKMKSALNVEMAMSGEGVLSEYFVINGLYFNNF